MREPCPAPQPGQLEPLLQLLADTHAAHGSADAPFGRASSADAPAQIVRAENHDILLHGALCASAGLVAHRLRSVPLPRRRWLHRRGCMRCGDAAAHRSLASIRISHRRLQPQSSGVACRLARTPVAARERRTVGAARSSVEFATTARSTTVARVVQLLSASVARQSATLCASASKQVTSWPLASAAALTSPTLVPTSTRCAVGPRRRSAAVTSATGPNEPQSRTASPTTSSRQTQWQ